MKGGTAIVQLNRIPGFWKDERNQRKHLKEIGEKLGVSKLDDWYKFTARSIRKLAPFISRYHNGSLFNALKRLYPENKWDSSLFPQSPQNHWKDLKNQRKHLENIASQLGISKLDDWYQYSARHVRKLAPFIVTYYNGSLFQTLEHLYPMHEWDRDRFLMVNSGHWKELSFQREHLDWLEKQLGIQSLNDWYKFTTNRVRKHLPFIYRYYNGSLYEMLKTLHPNHEWNPILFPKAPKRYWQQEKIHKYYRELLMNWKSEHNIQSLREWYDLPPNKVKVFQRVANSIHGGVSEMLQKWFPDTGWINEIQSSTPELQLQQMMGLVADIKTHHRIGNYVVDIYIPELNLALEYQGKQHFQQAQYGDLKSQQERDREKLQYFQQHNISLIPVGFQWNGMWTNLKATIKNANVNTIGHQTIF